MERYEILFSKSSIKELHKLAKPDIRSIVDKIEQLAIDPRPIGAMKLKGSKKALWRIRSGNFRVIYSIEDVIRIVEILAIGDRKDIY
jgi:mRNA interferase RelE/StbE